MGTKHMRAAVMTAIGRIETTRVPVPVPGPSEALIKVKSVGLCGSDVHFFTHGRIGPHVAAPPFILGHEASGEVVEVGETAGDLRAGDRVAMEPGVPCGVCDQCRTGRYNLCGRVRFWAAPPTQGALSDYVAHNARFCFKIPDNVSFEEAAMVEPLCVGVHAVKRAGASPGKCAVILGAGPIGQLVLQACLAYGLTDVIVTDVENTRLDVARASGARVVSNPKGEDLLAVVMGRTRNDGADIVFETAGTPGTAGEAVSLAKRGGTVVQIGNLPGESTPYPLLMVLEKELTLLGSFRYANCYPAAIEMLSSGRVKTGHLVSHRFDLERAGEAFALARDRKKECMKIIIGV